MGAHNRYASDYLRQSMRVLEETKADNVGGSMVCEGESYFSRPSPWLTTAGLASAARDGMIRNTKALPTPYSGASTAARFSTGSGSSTKNWSATRMTNSTSAWCSQAAGSGIHHALRVGTNRGDTLKALLQQYVQYGYWRVRVVQKRKAAASIRQYVPGAFVFSLMALPLAALLWSPAWWLWLSTSVAYGLCTIAISLAVAARQGWRYFPVLPWVFACYHLGYGIGFLHGMVDFVLLRRRATGFYNTLTRSSEST